MKNKIILYLFIFSLLYIIFQYMNSKKADKYFNEKVSFLSARVDSLEAENRFLQEKSRDMSYFALTEHDLARTYFESKEINPDELALKIQDLIIGMNGAEDNPLVPFPGMEGIMMVNHIHVLNNKWVIADFTDGVYWGEVLLEYFVEDDGSISFSSLDSFLYGRIY